MQYQWPTIAWRVVVNVSVAIKCQKVLVDLDGFWLFHSQLTNLILLSKTYHKPCARCACGLIILGIFFSSSIALIVALWNTSCHYWTNFNFLLPLSKTLFAFDGIPFGKLIFFFVGKVGCASWGWWKKPQSIPPISWKEAMRSVNANSGGEGTTYFASVTNFFYTIMTTKGGWGGIGSVKM